MALTLFLVAVIPFLAPGAPGAGKPSELIGTWQGTSICTDRVAAPACHDEVVVYEFTAGGTPGTVKWKADKVVDGRRATMGETDLAWDTGDRCWRAELAGPRARGVWCLAVDGGRLSGTAWLLPGKEKVRKVQLRKD